MKLMYSSGINARTDGLSQSTAHQDQSSLNLSIAQTCDVQKQQYQHREGDRDLMVRSRRVSADASRTIMLAIARHTSALRYLLSPAHHLRFACTAINLETLDSEST